MLEYLLILTLWTGETEYQNLYTEGFCQMHVQAWIAHEDTQKQYGPPKHMNIYCEPLAPGEPIMEWWKICTWRDGCWGPDTVNWSSIPPTKPGWYLHRYRVKDEWAYYDSPRPFEVRMINGVLSLWDSGVTWTTVLPNYPVASMTGEWTQDALVLRK